MQTILAIDDEPSIRETYRLILADQYHVLVAPDGASALKTLEETHVDLIILDLTMPGMSGMDVLDELARREAALPVLVVTARKSVTTAVDAMKRGACDYIIKPFDVDEITLNVERALAEQRHRTQLNVLLEADARGFEFIIGNSPALASVLDLARKAMHVDSTVLVTGESGTGKDLLVHAIHSGGKRSKEALVPVSCCAIPDQLVESELFGHEKGSFTGATGKRIGKVQVADGGTLFLDEIGEMPLDAQSKLLRVLQEGHFYPVGSSKVIEVDVRFVCATNRNLQEAVKAGTFREDLFYRINVLPIELPPLRQRREDIPMLVEAFVARHAARANAQTESFSSEALAKMSAYSWPGNVRELENLVERILVIHSDERCIGAEHLRGLLPGQEGEAMTGLSEFEGLAMEEATGRLERHLIERALERSGHVQSQAAELLGTTRRILKYKMDQLSIPTDGSAK
jgi:DNA-binding NtrC family response regulator